MAGPPDRLTLPDLLTLDDVVARDPQALSARIDGEVVTLDVARGACHGLDPIASRIWDIVERPLAIGEVCDRLREEYEVDEATCRTDVLGLFADLRAEGLITVQDAPSKTSAG